MADEDQQDQPPRIGGWAGALAGILNKEARGALSAVVVVAAFLLLFMFLPVAVGYMTRFLSGEDYRCWDLKVVEGQVIRFNECTGEAEPIDLKREP